MEAYKKLTITKETLTSKSTEDDEDDIDDDEEEQRNKDISESKINLYLKFCEKKLRSALRRCENDPTLVINRNIIDKLSRLSEHNKMNLNYIIGDIYILLMNKKSLFDYDSKDFEINDLLIFTNKVIQFKDTMKNTKIGMTYNDSLKKFLFSITEEFDLEEQQLRSIKKVLEENKEIIHNNIYKTSINDLVLSLSIELGKQPNIYEQYKIFIQNKLSIIKLIEESDLDEKSNYNNYLKLGKYLAYLFYNKSFFLYLENNDNNNEELSGIRHLIVDGYENKGEINVINSEKFYISEDDRISQLREQLCEIIIKYAEKFIEMIDTFAIQYIVYILVKRLYFCHYEKYKDDILPLISYSLINMCFFKESPIQLLSYFINKILKSKKQKDLELKNYIIENLKQAKDEKDFLYKIPKYLKLNEKKEDNKAEEDEKKEEKKEENKDDEEEEEEDEDDDDDEANENDIDKGLNKVKDEFMFMYHYDLKIGFLNTLTIKSGNKFVFYEEINQDYSILDFCLVLEDLDIKVTITDLTEGREIYNKDRLNSVFDTPLKIIMFFSSPRILKFEIDNSYSWIRDKKIKYKTNIFYPKYPYLIGYQILITKYLKTILQSKDLILKNKKNSKNRKKSIVDDGDKLLILKIDGDNKVFNCINVKQNLEAINKMVKDKYLSITSLFIKIRNNEKEKENNQDKSCFYYYKENEGLIENELKKEILEKHLYDILSKSNGNFNVVNLYVINGDSNIKKHYNYYSINKLLGFEPFIKIDGNTQKIIFVIQYLSQAQLLYHLYNQVHKQEYQDIVLLVNYTKFGGYQIILFNNEEIILNMNSFKGLNKNSSIDENINIIYNGIKKFKEDERHIDVVFTSSIVDKENDITPDKLEEKLMEKIGGNENDKKNIRIIKTDSAYNKELQINSHMFFI